MSAPVSRAWTREDYERDAREYYLSLTLEDFMEATPQSTQREITLASLNGLKASLGDIGYFNELLVQSRHLDELEKIVPDNMIVLGDPGLHKRKSYMVEFEQCPVYVVLEYVSDDPDKDYEKNFQRYQSIFKIPYYLIFDPDQQSLLLYRLRDGRYMPVEPDAKGRIPIQRLELEIGLLDGWVRFWFRGELIPVTAELRDQMNKMREQMNRMHQEMSKLQSANTLLAGKTTLLEKQLKERDDELKERDDELKERNNELKERDDELKERNNELKERDDELKARSDQLKERDDQLKAFVSVLRPIVESKARLAGREDILALLPGSTDPQQLQTWLLELG